MIRTLSLYHTCIYIVICVIAVTYLPLYHEWSFKTHCRENLNKLRINTYTWNLGMYDTSSERQEF